MTRHAPRTPSIVRARWAALLGVAAAIVLAVVWTSTGMPSTWRDGTAAPRWPEAGALRLEPGATRAYAVDVRAEGRVGAEGGDGATAFVLELQGVLVLHGYPGAAQEVGARLVEPSLTVNGQVPSYASALGVPFSFHLDGQGRYSAISFPPRLAGEAAVVLEQLMRRLQVVLPHVPRATWRTRERDAAGVFSAEYRVDPAATSIIEKRKLEYLSVRTGEPAPEVLSSWSRIELEAGLRGVRRVEGAEVLRRRSELFQGRESVTFRYEPAPPPPGALPETLAALAGARDDDPTADPAPAPPADLPGGHAVDEALRRFGDAYRRDPAAAEGLIAAWLRLAGAPSALVGALDGMAGDLEHAPLDAAHRAVLWRLLAQAGTPEGEAALLDAASNPAHPLLTRRQAVAHFGQVAVARPEMVAGLLRVHEAGRQPGGDPALGTMALLAAGALGHPDLASPALRRTVASALEQRLAGAAGPEEQAALLAAMGNAGEPCLPALRAALIDPAPSVRAAAVDGFRRMEGPAGRRALLEHAAVETDPGVRSRTLEMLRRLGPDREAIAWAAAEAGREPDRRVLLSLVDLLGAASERSSVARSALDALRETDDRELRKRVLRYVPPRRE